MEILKYVYENSNEVDKEILNIFVLNNMHRNLFLMIEHIEGDYHYFIYEKSYDDAKNRVISDNDSEDLAESKTREEFNRSSLNLDIENFNYILITDNITEENILIQLYNELSIDDKHDFNRFLLKNHIKDKLSFYLGLENEPYVIFYYNPDINMNEKNNQFKELLQDKLDKEIIEKLLYEGEYEVNFIFSS